MAARRHGPWLRAATGGIAAAALAFPGSAGAVVLGDALVSAYQTNPQLQSQRATLHATDELVNQALAGYRPQVFLDGAVQGSRGEIGQNRTFENQLLGQKFNGSQDGSQTSDFTTKQVDLTLRQNLYAGGGTTASVRQAENQVRAAQADLLAAEQSVLLSAVDAYSTAWQNGSVLDLALNNEQRLRRELEATRDRFRVGEVARTDVAQAEARLSQARADVESAKSNLSSSRATYKQVIGTDAGPLDAPRATTQLPATLEQAQAIAANNPTLQSANYTLAAARDAVRVAYANLLPSVDLQGELLYANQPSSQTPWERQATLGVTVTIPLYQGGAEYAAVRRSKQLLASNQSGIETSTRSIAQSVSATWDQLAAARAAIQSFRDAVRANQIAVEGVRQEALVGSRTVLDVLDQEQDLFSSQVNLVRSQRDEVVVSYQLKSAIGQLTVADLALRVEPYDAQAYYGRNRSRLYGVDGGK